MSTRLQHLQERQQRLLTRLFALEKTYDLETRVEEKLRLEALIADNQKNLAEVQAQIAILRGGDLELNQWIPPKTHAYRYCPHARKWPQLQLSNQ